MPDTTPGQFLAARRAELGLGVSEMARATGIPPGQISQFENDRWPNTKVTTIVRLARAYRVDEVMLFKIWARSPLLEVPADA